MRFRYRKVQKWTLEKSSINKNKPFWAGGPVRAVLPRSQIRDIYSLAGVFCCCHTKTLLLNLGYFWVSSTEFPLVSGTNRSWQAIVTIINCSPSSVAKNSANKNTPQVVVTTTNHVLVWTTLSLTILFFHWILSARHIASIICRKIWTEKYIQQIIFWFSRIPSSTLPRHVYGSKHQNKCCRRIPRFFWCSLIHLELWWRAVAKVICTAWCKLQDIFMLCIQQHCP